MVPGAIVPGHLPSLSRLHSPLRATQRSPLRRTASRWHEHRMTRSATEVRMKILSEVHFVGMKPSASTEQQVQSTLDQLDPLCGRLVSAQVEIRAKHRRPLALRLRLAFADAVTYVTTPIVQGVAGVNLALEAALLQSMRHYIRDRLSDDRATALAA
jgi:hypothetical protein